MAAPSVTMSCTNMIQRVRRTPENIIAGASAGKHGVTAMIASAEGRSGAAIDWASAKLASWRRRSALLSRPIHKGRRKTGTVAIFPVGPPSHAPVGSG